MSHPVDNKFLPSKGVFKHNTYNLEIVKYTWNTQNWGVYIYLYFFSSF